MRTGAPNREHLKTILLEQASTGELANRCDRGLRPPFSFSHHENADGTSTLLSQLCHRTLARHVPTDICRKISVSGARSDAAKRSYSACAAL